MQREAEGKDIWAGTSDQTTTALCGIRCPAHRIGFGGRNPTGSGAVRHERECEGVREDCWHENYRNAGDDGSARL